MAVCQLASGVCRHAVPEIRQYQTLQAYKTGLASRRRQPLTNRALSGATAGFLSSVLATGTLLAADADLQLGWRDSAADSQQVVATSQQVQDAPQLPAAPAAVAASPTAFDLILLSVVHVTDDLSRAADGLLDLTAAAEVSTPSAAAEASTPATSGSAAAVSSLQVTPVLHASTPSATSDAFPADGSTLLLSDQQAQRMSQQALTVAAEALRLATLLEGQDSSCDPAEQELLQQIAAAARLVSVMAADMIQPAGAQDTLATGADSSSSQGASLAVAAASREAADPAGAGDGANSSASEGPKRPSFAGLPVLGVRAACSSPVGDLAAAAPVSRGLAECLHL